MKNSLWCAFIAFIMVGVSVDPLLGQNSLQNTVQKALECHPLLAAAKSDIAIAQAGLIDAGKLDNPYLEFGLTSQVTDGPDREGSVFVGYSQAFPVTAKLLRERDLRASDVRLACAEVKEVERNFIAKIQSKYIAAVGARQLIEALQQLEADADQYVILAKNQASIAQGSDLDVAAAETEKILASQARQLAEGRYREALVELRSLLVSQLKSEFYPTQSLDAILSELEPTVRYTIPETFERSDVVVAEVRKQRSRNDEKLAQSETLEDWEILTGYQAGRTIDEPIGVERERFLNIGLKVPLPIRKQGQGRIAEAKAKTAKAHNQLETTKLNSRSEVEVAIARVTSAKKSESILKSSVLPQLRERESRTREAYGQGLVDFSQVVLIRQQQSRTLKALTEVKLEKILAISDLQYALGSNPNLHVYNPVDCQLYKPGTEPRNAPFALPVLDRVKPPLENNSKHGTKGKPLKRFFNKIIEKKR